MNQCKRCSNRADCWVKSAIEGKIPLTRFTDSKRDMDLIIAASNGDCKVNNPMPAEAKFITGVGWVE